MSGSTVLGPAAIQSVRDLPFRERPVLDLLGLTEARDTLDLDYTGFGWARIDQLWLADATSGRAVDDVLLLALHAADAGLALADDVELEFVLDPNADPAAAERSVTAMASVFLERWLPVLPPASAIVLAMCNPHGARLRPPRAAGTTPLYHGIGDVDSWLDPTPTGDRLRLQAASWQRRSPEAPP